MLWNVSLLQDQGLMLDLILPPWVFFSFSLGTYLSLCGSPKGSDHKCVSLDFHNQKQHSILGLFQGFKLRYPGM